MSRVESVVQAWYEDADLRDSLTDDEAEVLLKWASEQAARLDASAVDDVAFEEQADHLRRLVKRLNRTAGESAYAAPEAQAAGLTAIAETAQAAGLAFTPAFSAQAAPASPAEALSRLLAALTPVDAASAPPPASAPEAPSPELPAAPPSPSFTASDDEEFHDL